mgnify:CR=1 FL=1
MHPAFFKAHHLSARILSFPGTSVGLGNDAFEFQNTDGHDVVTDFGFGAGDDDLLQLFNFGFASAQDALDAFVQDGADALLVIDANTSIRLTGVDVTYTDGDVTNDLTVNDILIGG